MKNGHKELIYDVYFIYISKRGGFLLQLLYSVVHWEVVLQCHFQFPPIKYSSTFYWSVFIKPRKSAVWIIIGVSILYFSTIFLFNVDTVQTVLYYLLFRLDFRVVWYYLFFISFWKRNKSCLYLRHPMACAVQLVDVLIIVHKLTSYSEPWHTTFFPLFWFEMP